MKRKIKILFILNLIFYFLIIFHRYVIKTYGDDYLLHVMIYMSLSFSSCVMEESFRKKIYELRVISLVDFTSRLLVLIAHFIYLFYDLNIYIVNLSIGILFCLDILLEIIMLKKSRDINEDKIEVIKDVEIRKFIDNYYNNYLKVGNKVNNELKDTINSVEISGKVTLIGVILFFSIFISSFIYKNLNNLMFSVIILDIILLYIFVILNCKLINSSLNEEENKRIKKVFENISFIIGYIIIFFCEVILQGKLESMRVSIWVLSILTFMPTLNRKFKIKEDLKIAYKKYKEILE